MASLDRLPALAAVLGGGTAARTSAAWAALDLARDELLDVCASEDLWSLVHARLPGLSDGSSLAEPVRAQIAAAAREQTARELLGAAEIRRVLAALAEADVPALLIKGTALAYTRYDQPASRGRSDTDLLVRVADLEASRAVLASLGYSQTVQCSDLFSQYEVQKVDGFGVVHAFDVHWRIITQPAFSGLFDYDELRSRAQPVPALGAHAWAPADVDALTLACVHPVMHHRNEERVLWMYDIHLLASALTPDAFEDLIQSARRKQVAEICANQLRRTCALFATPVPSWVVDRLARDSGEPTAEYLSARRRWHHELASSLRGLRSFRARAGLLRQVLFPGPRYMLSAYGVSGKPLGYLLLPVLYVHRQVYGVWKILARKK